MAAWLFGRAVPVPEVEPLPAGFLPWRAVDAARTHRRLVRDTRAGSWRPGSGCGRCCRPMPRPDGARSMRTLVRHRSQLRGPTVTVAVLAAVSKPCPVCSAMPADSLGAEVPMAKPGVPQANNHFGNVTVGLYPELGLDARIERIATDLANGRRRFEHPATRSADRAFAVVPAALLRWGVAQFDPDVRPAQVAGNTVVSSVNRGAADLSFGDARGGADGRISGIVAVDGSDARGAWHWRYRRDQRLHAAQSAVPDIDAYVGCWTRRCSFSHPHASVIRRVDDLGLHFMTPYDVGLLILRLVLGVTLAAHGYNKFFGGGRIPGTARWFESIGMKPGKFHATVAATTEIAAGLGLAAGLLTPIPAAGFVSLMLVAAWTVHRHNGFFIVKEGWEYNLVLAVSAVAVATIGPGRLSLDWLIFGKNWLDGWQGLLISVGLGLAGAIGQLLIFYRPPAKQAG